MRDRSSATVLATVMVWGGVAAFEACLLMRFAAPAPRGDLLMCVAVSMAGLLLGWVRVDALRRNIVNLPHVPAPPRPSGVHMRGTWWPDRSLRAGLGAFAAVILPLQLLYIWVLDGSAMLPGRFSEEGHQLTVPVMLVLVTVYAVHIALWALPLRRFRRYPVDGDETNIAEIVENAVCEGAARALPVVVSGAGAGAHAPQPSSHTPVNRRRPQYSSLLRLSAYGGERELFIDRPVDVEPLGAALHGRQGWLYWAPTGMERPGWTVPAFLVLGDGRFIRGWTHGALNAPMPQGEQFHDPDPQHWPEVRPMEPAVLRPRPVLAGTLCFGLALLGVCAVSVGAVAGVDAGLQLAIVHVAPLLIPVGLLLNWVVRTERLKGFAPPMALRIFAAGASQAAGSRSAAAAGYAPPPPPALPPQPRTPPTGNDREDGERTS